MGRTLLCFLGAHQVPRPSTKQADSMDIPRGAAIHCTLSTKALYSGNGTYLLVCLVNCTRALLRLRM